MVPIMIKMAISTATMKAMTTKKIKKKREAFESLQDAAQLFSIVAKTR